MVKSFSLGASGISSLLSTTTNMNSFLGFISEISSYAIHMNMDTLFFLFKTCSSTLYIYLPLLFQFNRWVDILNFRVRTVFPRKA